MTGAAVTKVPAKRGRGRPALPPDLKRHTLQIRLRDDARERLRIEAKGNDRSLAAHIEAILLEHLKLRRIAS